MKKIVIAFIVLSMLLLNLPQTGNCFFFQESEITLVKDMPFPGDKSVTFGKILDSYKYCKDGKWTVNKTDRGQTFVEFRGKYSNASFVELMVKPNFIDDSDITFKKISDTLDKYGFKVDFAVQFLINADSKGFKVAFIGYDYNGDTIPVGVDGAFGSLLKNDHFKHYLPISAVKAFNYFFHKYILEQVDGSQLKFACPISLYGSKVSIPREKHPIAIMKINQITFNDKLLTATTSINYEITDFTPEKMALHGITYSSRPIDLNKVKFPQDAYSILQKGSINLPLLVSDSGGYKEVAFDSGRKSQETARFSFELTRVDPLTFTPSSMDYSGNLNDAVKNYVINEYDAKKSSEKIIQEKNTAEMKAYENWRRALRASTPDQESLAKELSNTIRGVYALKAEEIAGKMTLTESKEQGKEHHVDIETASEKNGNTCEFVGECVVKGYGFVCINDNFKEDSGSYVEISIINGGLEITKSGYQFCGSGAHMEGRYKRN